MVNTYICIVAVYPYQYIYVCVYICMCVYVCISSYINGEFADSDLLH